ncbi:MAG: AMP-binding protein [Patescibacteria group bacterium]|nr:AMP-binding protein [Patescibacteria group bacterium]
MKNNTPILLLFSSGTSGKSAKPIIYTMEDKINMEKCISRFSMIHKQAGVYYNLLPFAPHLGYYLGAMYGEITGSLTINTGGGKHVTSEKTINIMKSFPPEMIAGLPGYILKTLNLAKENNVDLSRMKLIIGANGINNKFIQESRMLCPGTIIYATYGFTEARVAWTTCDDLSCGYHVFTESGKFEVDSLNNELIFYSNHYPEGFRTGDVGTILEGESCPNCGNKCQRVGFEIKRLDGMVKNYDI